ncbi:xanthine dehydrogenase family protein molybdopterin-binding subunit [Athalassotoga saccharophila]|uniref:xanthine dehydrogenase family protein molybdopterin-binding subunit n=1 Tax=Athalassotoga saccharophila TaxID=1441386 RepID=UPI00137B55C5|nr:molybdopterin cofactor-binding domain-containing protein [Athalassotoga saccharophila]BBJ27416.1 aerobic-type carbon monoxide dehydrogenase, large subunit CoxL CutL-like protein [Athalassotoga saccharophila]
MSKVLTEEKLNVVNTPVEKVDGKALVRGKPVFTDDFDLPNALTVKILRSPHAHAIIKSIDTSEAMIEGVACILTYKDVPHVIYTRAGQGYPEPSPYDTFILDKKVRYVGDAVAIIAAENENIAERAMKLIKVDYEILPAILDYEHAQDPDAPVIHDEPEISGSYDPKHNIASHYEMEIGNVEEELKKCDYTIDEVYYTPNQSHAMMEPHTAISYFDPNGRLTVITSTQVPFHARRILNRLFGVNCRVIKPRIGGGFGGKQAIHVEPYVVAVTLKTGRPAKCVYTREETMTATNTRHAMRFRVRAGAMKDGTLRAIELWGLSNTGAYGEHALTVFMVAGSKTLPLYNKVKAVKFGGDVVYSNTEPAGAFRGYGAPQGMFALDSALDELARKIGIDPIEFKLKNSIREGETSPIFRIMGEGREGVDQIIRSCKIEECAIEGSKIFNWYEKIKRPRIDMKKKVAHGYGVAFAMQGSSIPAIDMGGATLKMNDDGTFNLLVGATDLGTGSDTILAQIAAEVLHTTVDKITVYSSDTDMTPFDKGAYASSTTYVSGNAVKKAAEKMKKEILKAASELFEKPVEFLDLEEDKVVCDDGRSISFAELQTKLFYTFNQRQLEVTESFVSEVAPPPYLVSFAEVEIDMETGKVKVVDFLNYIDCGVPINPILARGQVEGASAQGIGIALFEDHIMDKNGRLITDDFFTYKIPARGDIGKIEVRFAKSYEPTGPFGAKSVSEIGLDTPGPAIANAIYDALGIRMRRLPIRSEELFFEIRKKYG